MALDNLAVSISSQTADVTSGIASVRRGFNALGRDAAETGGALDFAAGQAEDMGDESLQLAAQLLALSRAADEAGDEISQAGRRAATTGGLFSALSLSTDGLSFSFGSLSTVTTLSLIPALFALSAALVPIVSAFALLTGGAVALGGAFAAVLGLGLIGGFQEIKQALIDVRDAVMPFVRLVGQQFTPLILDAIDALRPLAFEILSVIGSRADDFKESLRSLGGTVADVLPGLVSGLFDLADIALPVFEDFISFLKSDGGDILAGIRESAMSVTPALLDLLDAIMDFAPEFGDFGSTVANIVIPGLTRLLRAGTDVLTWVNSLDAGTQGLIATGAALAPILAKLGTLLVGLGGPVGLIIGGIAALGAAWATNFGNIRGVVDRFSQKIQGVLGDRLPTLIAEVKQLMRTILPIVEPIFNALLNIAGEFVTTGLDVILSTLTALVQLLNGDVSGALETIGRLMIRVGNSVLRVVTRVAEGVVNAVIEAVNQLSRAINDRLVASLPEDVQAAVGEDPFVQNLQPVSFTAPQIQGGQPPADIAQSRQQDQRIVLELKDDLLRARAREEATVVVEQESRTRNRRSGRGRGA